MKFCPECGTGIEGMKFCPECGYKVGSAGEPTPQEQTTPLQVHDGEYVICEFDTKLLIGDKFEKNLVGDVKLTRSKEIYTLTSERLIIEKKGVIRSQREEIEGFKIKDIQVRQGVIDKARKIGDITIFSSDVTTPTHILENIENPHEIADKIRAMARNCIKEMNIMHHESV